MPEPGLDILGKRLGNWKVLLSPKALKRNFGSIEQKLRELASGSWEHPRLYYGIGSEQQRKKLRVPLAATRCNAQTSILWQVDIASDDTPHTECQVVKIWEVADETELAQVIDRVILLQKSCPDELFTQCRQKGLEDTAKNLLPRSFTSHSDTAKPGEEVQGLDVRTVDREVLQMVNRFYTLTEPMIRSVLANDLWAEFPFDFSSDETRVILHFDTSNLILGRSGTGKTTCLVFKLLAKYAAGCALMEERSPRQLLLTRSAELANKLKDYIDRLVRALPKKSIDAGQEQETELPLPDVGTEDDQPSTVFQLQNRSFPLVCTFDRLLELFENTVDYVDREGFPVTNEDENDDTQEKDQSDQSESSEEEIPWWQPSTKSTIAQFIDSQSFRLDYWPRFPANLVKNLPVELAFAEIIGVIQGSISSRETLKPLSREAYLELSSRVAPTFTLETEKSQIYDLFEKYQALKLQRREMDGVDRVTKLIKAVRDNQRLKDIMGATFDEIYIDEVQDLRCLHIELLLSILNEGRAFHFAGDTAQTISQDSHFRFQDIKALFYDHFAGAASLANQPELSRPRLFMLGKNYRSHQGILGLASLVMEMLWNGFPETVDKLEPEIGQIYGPIPVFFLNCNVQMLASGDTSSDEHPKQTLDFGAEQAIIVRDQSTKAKLQAELKDKALILTVLQSKGMEFEDVFLWNFFTDSPCPGGWRCLDTLKTKSGKFDSKKYAAMCSELKQFYVAVTRTRIRLSIIESEEILAVRVADLLKHDVSSPLVEVTTSSDPDFLQELLSLRSVSHDPYKWSDRGHELMQRKQFDDAVICFRRAKDKGGETCTTAYIFEEKGRHLTSSGDAGAARDCFQSAFQKFLELDIIAEAVRCLEKLEEYHEAALLWAQSGNSLRAAPLFAKAGMFKEASDHFHKARNYDKAVDALRQGDLAENLVPYVTENQKKLSPRSFKSHSRFCIYLLQQNNIGSHLLTPAIRLLGSPKEQKEAFMAYEIHDQLADLYAEQRKFKERLLLFFRIGKLGHALKAITDRSPADTNSKSVKEAQQRVQNYYFASQIVCPRRDEVQIPHQLLSSNSDWITAQRLMTSKQRGAIIGNIETIKNGVVKDFLRLHALLNLGLLDIVPTLDAVPFCGIETVFKMAEGVSSLAEHTHDPIILLLTGVMKVDHGTKPFILLKWSPFMNSRPMSTP
ncbi:hypothetical protein EPUS_00725 [Endocarpon pusillum Z07020]|uniref:UvrD-like helicase ATP-binding domain-containing protein n=1 Tax=Endocarpon pusillum (strain Z07020 / HMAS-L-300199) TaxID=1263415 RepID=U1HV87_ENDPU|nr:uncharacterized protein EPUS_00725 [Endocarpon pusillum Z07020]ERF74595.1 hypothetical protein EPUS_00725 [Endocarpon pusillum Z07020]